LNHQLLEKKTLVILLNRNTAKFYEFYKGRITEKASVCHEVPQEVKKAGWYGLRDGKIHRHIQDHLRAHFKKVNQIALKFLYKYKQIILASEPENISFFEPLMHNYLKKRLVAKIPVNLLNQPKLVIINKICAVLENTSRKAA